MRVNILKLAEENRGVNVCDFGLDNGFLKMTPKAQRTKKKQVIWTLPKL